MNSMGNAGEQPRKEQSSPHDRLVYTPIMGAAFAYTFRQGWFSLCRQNHLLLFEKLTLDFCKCRKA
jgi:hypothetical protein